MVVVVVVVPGVSVGACGGGGDCGGLFVLGSCGSQAGW